MLPLTSGDITVCGRSVRSDPAGARASLGVCPQQTVLCPCLTVLEHLALFAVLKGVARGGAAAAAAAEAAASVDLTLKSHTRADALSGGMKRRLQLAIALVGGSKVVICDEPTSGLDPVARRGVWGLLRSARRGRAILLTTHYLDEADLLADRVAVPADGRVAASGSPLFLKRRIGGGPVLSVTCATADAGPESGGGGGCGGGGSFGGGSFRSSSSGGGGGGNGGVAAINADVTDCLPGARLFRVAGGEAAWRLPSDADRSAVGALLRRLEADAAADGAAAAADGGGASGAASSSACVRIASASLEEVFLTLAPPRLGGAGAGGGDASAAAARCVASPLSPPHSLAPPPPPLPPRRKSILPSTRGALLGAVASAAAAEEAESARMLAECPPEALGGASSPRATPPRTVLAAAAVHRGAPLTPRAARRKRVWRCFCALLAKRLRNARRDRAGVLSSLLLPPAAVALVLLVLTLHVSPAGPQLRLSAQTLSAAAGHATPVLLPGSPSAASSLAAAFSPAAAINWAPLPSVAANSTAVSQHLLESPPPDGRFAYAAFVPNDAQLPALAPAKCLAPLPFSTGQNLGEALWVLRCVGPSFFTQNTFWDPTLPHNFTQNRVSSADARLPRRASAATGGLGTWRTNATAAAAGLANASAEAAASPEAVAFTKALGGGGLFEAARLGSSLNILHNTSCAHALPLHFAELQASRSLAAGGPDVRVSSWPLPLSAVEAASIAKLLSILASFFVLIPFSYLPAAVAAFPVKERACGAKAI